MKLPAQRDENFNKVSSRSMKYAILYGTLFNRLSHIETIRILGKRLQKAVDSLAVLFGKPSFETLTKSLNLYQKGMTMYFMNHVENMIRSLS